MNPSKTLLDLVFPPRCAFCGALVSPTPADTRICPDCSKHLPMTGSEHRLQYGDFFSYVVSPLFYEEPVESSIRGYKFHGKLWHRIAYRPILEDCLRSCPDIAPDLITWAPLSTLRYLSRGYDQAKLLAEDVAGFYGKSPVRLLKKVKHTKAQSKLSVEARLKNARDAYALHRPVSPEGKQILLVDDVVTTGATLSACSRLLLEAGASSVLCLTLARSVSPVKLSKSPDEK